MKKISHFASPFRDGLALGLWLVLSTSAPAGTNLTRGSSSSSPGQGPASGSSASTSQTSTAATTATSQSVQTSISAQRAQVSLLRSTQALQAVENAQSAARNLFLAPNSPNNLGTLAQPLPNVPNGLVVGGLVPGVKGTDAADPTTIATTVPVTANSNGTTSVTLGANSAITLPPSATGSSQITVSGTGTVGSITTGGTIIPITAGVAATVVPGSTISLTSPGTITFTGGSGAIPSTFSTYTYTVPATSTMPATTAPVPSSWSGVGGLTQSTYSPSTGQTSDQTTVTVTQTVPTALLTWQTFNIGKNTTLDFDQSAGGANVADWVAINKVAANIAPSQILGSIQAPGQVYVINQNGIIFGGSSQVNAGALVASSLPINDNLVSRGLLNNPDLQFLFSQLDISAGTQGPTPAFKPEENDPAPGANGNNGGLVAHVDSAGTLRLTSAAGQDGDVVVQAGAQLSSPATALNVGGRVALVGPNVNNAGTISTPDGQTILAAGLQVGFQAHNTNDPSLRGLDTYVGAITDLSLPTPEFTAGTATNIGLIGTLSASGVVSATPGADVTMAGANVNQSGVIDLSTSVNLNSRVDLLADYATEPFFNGVAGFHGTTGFYPTSSGGVTLGPDSVTELTPDLSSNATVVGTQLALPSLVNIQGLSIDMGPDALLLANSAAVPSNASQPAVDLTNSILSSGVTLNAGQWAFAGGTTSFYNSSGQVALDPSATIDVSGSENVAASVADNIVAAQLLASELANSPLQQDGSLHGQTVYVDIRDLGVYNGTPWIGTPLADVSGYVNLVQHNVGELTTKGGTVSISAGQSVNLASGSNINVSGGWINYAGANVQTTKVVSNGQILDISLATPNLTYQGIYTGFTATSAKWGVSQTYANSLVTGSQYEAGYLQGGSGGTVAITSPAISLNGNLYGNTVSGSSQRTSSSSLNSTYAGASFLPTILATQALPQASELSLSFTGQNAANNYLSYSPSPADIVFQPATDAKVANPFVGSGNTEVDLSSDLINADGFANLTIENSDGNFFVPAGVALTTAVDGSINLKGANILVDGSLNSPGGNLNFTVYDYSPFNYTPLLAAPAVDSSRGVFTLGSTASLNVAGLVVDDRSTTASAGTLPLATKGGTISINTYSADLSAGSSINVSGGVNVSAANKIAYGNGGSLSILAGQDPGVQGLIGGQLNLASTIEGYSGAQGGSLTIQAPLIQLGGTASSAPDPANTLVLFQGFFSQDGFSSFTLNGLGEVAPNQSDSSLYLPAVSVLAGATIDPIVQSWVATLGNNGVVLSPTTLPLASERTSASLTLNALGVTSPGGTLEVRGDVVLGSGSLIETDPKGNVTVNGATVDVLGEIIAPGGTITITGAKNSGGLNFSDSVDPLVTVDIGANSILNTAGVVELTANSSGYTTGTVLSGGQINIAGNIVAEKGALFNVSGTSGVLDEQTAQSVAFSDLRSSPALVPTEESSSGGQITFTGGQEFFSAATLLGAPGGASAEGGSLVISSQHFDASQGTIATTPRDISLEVTQSVLNYSSSGIGNTLLVNGTMAGLGYFGASSNLFVTTNAIADPVNNGGRAGGFDSLTLAGTVQFSGSVAITANRSISVGSSGVVLIDPSVANSSVTLTAPYVDLGQAFQGPLTEIQQQLPIFTDSNGQAVEISPTYASDETLTINASSLIDVGNVALQNIGNLNLAAPNGDIRGDGTLDVAGNISLTAGQIYPPTETTFTIAAYDYNGILGNGSVSIAGSGTRQLPLSAGGALNVYASNITQGGVLRAPIGTINLGSGVTGPSPIDPLSGQTFNPTQNLTLTAGSITSVSTVDPVTGQNLTIPYGTLLNGVSWIDPAGNDITVAGNGPNAIPNKAINLAGANVTDQTGATIDISGGADLSAYQFVSGTGGTNDILASTTSFAIIPGYLADYAPDGGYNVTQNSANAYNTSGSISDYGYTNSKLSLGEQIYLNATNGLPAGVYTLLPARYALLPGAFLVTPKSGSPVAPNLAQPDGSSIVAGYLFNGLSNSAQTSPPLLSAFEVDSPAVVKSRAEYDVYSANTFLRQSAASQGASVSLPVDAGQLVLAATNNMTIQGAVSSQAPTGGAGGQVDIATTSNILISGPNTDVSVDVGGLTGSTLVLDSSDLSAFGADSLLIGGYRTLTLAGTTVTVTTSDLIVDNSGASTVVNGATLKGLSGPDVILASNGSLTLDKNADIEQSGTLSSAAETLLLGNANVAGSGNGVLLRVSSDSSAQIIRSGVTANTVGPVLTIGPGVKIAGASLTLDSTSVTALDSTADLSGNAVSINSGKINLVLDNSQPSSGLVLSSTALTNLQASAKALSLLSYSSIDIFGSGTIGSAADASGNYQVQSLALHADEILGQDGGTVVINAQSVTLDNSAGGVPSAVGGVPTEGALVVNAGTIQLGGGSGANALNIDGYATVTLNASGGILVAASNSSSVNDSSGNPVSVKGTASLTTAGSLQITTPIIVGATGADQTLTANGVLTINPVTDGSTTTVTGGLGATLNLVGTSVTENSQIQLPSGDLSIVAKTGNITVGGTLDASGTTKTFNDVTEYTSGGQISLTSDAGSVVLNPGSAVSVAADPGGGNGGSLTVSAAQGLFTYDGSTINGQSGTSGQGGLVSLDVGSIPGGNLQGLDSVLDGGGFTQSISIRDRSDTSVVVNGSVTAATYHLSVDQGSITVNGMINADSALNAPGVATTDASGKLIYVGGSINLEAGDNITLASTAVLNASGQNFSNAGKGGSVTLTSGANRVVKGVDVTNYSGSVNITSGSTIDLRIAANDNSCGSVNAASVAANAALGNFSGTLLIEAPRIGETDVRVNPIDGTIQGASSLTVVANQVYNTTAYGDGAGSIGGNGSDITTAITNDGNSLLGAEGQASATYGTMTTRLFGKLDAASLAVANVEVGARIVNPTGDITLASDWDLSQFRFGPNSSAGVLTLQALGNLVFQGSLSDGFMDATNTALLLPQNPAVPVNNQSWSYNLVAGADFGAADLSRVLPNAEAYDPTTGLAIPGTAAGSLELGNFVSSANGTVSIKNGQAGAVPSGDYQVIRTGAGNINIATAGDVLLQNQFATIYTAGVQAPDISNFQTPILAQSKLTPYGAQYSLAGGNVTISAQGNIAHVTRVNSTGAIVVDSEKELPNNWLYRRGYVVQSNDPSPGTATPGEFGTTENGDVASTSWWVDFSNFFEGVGALGGGNVTLNAGHDVSNVDAVVPTNARVTYQTSTGNLLASQQTKIELGGGNVLVQAGNDINAGAYYVERGQGTLAAGDSIITNYTRSPSTGSLTTKNTIDNQDSWLPTTLFLGEGSFEVTAQNNLLLGPVANPFLLPQGVNNTYWDKSYFSTYATTDAVSVTSLTGAVTLREETSPSTDTIAPLLQTWFQNVDLLGLSSTTQTVSNFQPWLNITETSVQPFSSIDALLPSTLQVAALSGNIDTVGNLTLSPSPTGTVDFLAAGSINGLQPNGIGSDGASATWSSTTINLSDANPSAIPGAYSPYAYENVVGTFPAAKQTTNGQIKIGGVSVLVSLDFSFINDLFAESGSTEGLQGVLQTKQQLHASINNAPLHANDPIPVHLYTGTGNISGLTLFSGKATRVVAGQDITDVALYVQNDNANDISLVAAGRDIIPYDANSPLRVEALSANNILNSGQTTLDGDIQVSGPGTLEVLAGRNLNLGDGLNNPDGTGVGISSIGNQRNPVLPFGGADIFAAAGLGESAGFDASQMNFGTISLVNGVPVVDDPSSFIGEFLSPITSGNEGARYLPDLGTLMGLPSDDTTEHIWSAFGQLSSEKQDTLALDVFYLVLRDAGRDHNNPSSPGAGNYDAGFAAIKALFSGTAPDASWPGQGNISLTSREIKTTNGGNINLLVPGGQLDVGLNVSGVQPIDQGILTEDGGNISIFTSGDVNVGTSRIFTLNGGNEIIWSTNGNIGAGASSKTVQSAPPTRVLVDPQSGAVQTDLAGLATGGGIGVLETVAGAPPADVDLIAPNGTVNAGDAGIRASGNLNIAAVQVLNAGNIQVGGKSSGVPTTVAPNVAGLSAASNAAGSATSAASQVANAARNQAAQQNQDGLPSIITVEVLGYGGGSGDGTD